MVFFSGAGIFLSLSTSKRFDESHDVIAGRKGKGAPAVFLLAKASDEASWLVETLALEGAVVLCHGYGAILWTTRPSHALGFGVRC